jgi:hypothetical protein
MREEKENREIETETETETNSKVGLTESKIEHEQHRETIKKVIERLRKGF